MEFNSQIQAAVCKQKRCRNFKNYTHHFTYEHRSEIYTCYTERGEDTFPMGKESKCKDEQMTEITTKI